MGGVLVLNAYMSHTISFYLPINDWRNPTKFANLKKKL